MTISTEYRMLINGQLVAGRNKSFSVIDPATGSPVTTDCPHADESQVAEAIHAAESAFALWSNLSLGERQDFLTKLAAALETHADDLAKLLSREQGKPLANAKSEVESGIEALNNCSKIEIPVTIVSQTESHSLELHRKPLGVVAAIIPWNYPVYIALVKILHALVYGNTVIVKPSPYTPLSTLKLGEIAATVLPAGTVNIIAGPDTRDERCVGDQLARHPKISLVAFTGSIPTGKRVFQNCAPKLARMILELGGNDPAIVLRDADVDKTAKGIFEGSMINCGQICCGIKRVYVHESIIEPFTAKLAELAKDRVKLIGAGSNPSVKLGPLNNEMQFKRVSELVEDAVKNGASLVAGGKKPAHVDQNGYFYEPTVLVNVKEGMRIVDEEQFGPIIPVLSYQSDDEVIQRANATKYGLGASVWGSDPEYVNSMAKKVLAGTVWTNEHAADGPGLPFGGFRESGIGREGGDYDLLTYTECQSVKLLRK